MVAGSIRPRFAHCRHCCLSGASMIYEIYKTWWGRWRVIEIGHTEGDRTWVATFRIEGDARRFVRALGGRL